MISIQMKTIGDVSFESSLKTTEGYRYDIPCDKFGIPCIPIGRILSDHGIDLNDLTVGFAHPDGYMRLSVEAGKILKEAPEALSFIRGYFTNSRFLKNEGYNIRSLKAGQTFFASLSFSSEGSDRSKKEGELRTALPGIRHIGVVTEGISGEVSFSLVEMEDFRTEPPGLSDLCSYHALDYSVLLVTPTCFYQPYADGPTTSLYIPGSEIHELLRKSSAINDEDEEEICCTNAYLSDGRTRLLPVPACACLVKLDKTQLRYRIAPGRDPHRSEQPAALNNCYTDDTESHLLVYTSPETERILSQEGQMTDALTAGQTFRGTVYGSDSQIRRIAAFFRENAVFNIGSFTKEGFGEAIFSIDRVREKAPNTRILTDCFDVCCLSDTLILNEEGMSAVSAEDLLGEIEYLLKVPGELTIESKYTGIYKDYSRNIRWDRDGAIFRCIAKGSILRVKRKDGQAMDISPVLHTFIGEMQSDGWGEIRTTPARAGYYRLAMETDPVLYAVDYPDSFRQMNLSAHMINRVMEDMLKSRVKALAQVDREEYRRGVSLEELMPEEIFTIYQNRFAPEFPMETLFDWYKEELKR